MGDGPRARGMLSYETFDWLLWMRPIESLLGVNSVPSHASDKHAWVTCHRYQPPPLFIRSCTPTSAVRAWINTAGSISTYTTGPVISDKHTPLRYSVCSVWPVVGQVTQTEQAYPKHTHTHTHLNHILQTTGSSFSSMCRKIFIFLSQFCPSNWLPSLRLHMHSSRRPALGALIYRVSVC